MCLMDLEGKDSDTHSGLMMMVDIQSLAMLTLISKNVEQEKKAIKIDLQMLFVKM